MQGVTIIANACLYKLVSCRVHLCKDFDAVPMRKTATYTAVAVNKT